MKANIKNKHVTGIIYMLLAMLFFAISDASVKFAVKKLENDLSLFNVICVRGIFVSILILIGKTSHLP